MKPALTPKELAEAIGVSESSLKRWADSGLIQVSRTGGGHRRIAVAEAIRFIRDTNQILVRPNILGLRDVETLEARPADDGDDAGRLYSYLHEGQARAARGLLLSWYLAGRRIAEICDGPLREAMDRIGEIWQHSEAGIFIEHRATDICIQALNQLRLLAEPQDQGPVAVGGAPSRDPYILPSICVSAVLAGEGVRTINLGADTPIGVLMRAAIQHRARLVYVSVSAPGDPVLLSQDLATLAERIASLGAALVIGGRAVPQVRVPDLPHVHVCERLADLLPVVARVAASPGRPRQEAG